MDLAEKIEKYGRVAFHVRKWRMRGLSEEEIKEIAREEIERNGRDKEEWKLYLEGKLEEKIKEITKK